MRHIFYRTRLVVVNLHDRKRWSILFAHVNLENVPVDLPSNAQQPLDRSTLKVGDEVSFPDRQGREKYGIVKGLNPKTAAVLTRDGENWRVAYVHLQRVLDLNVAETGTPGVEIIIPKRRPP